MSHKHDVKHRQRQKKIKKQQLWSRRAHRERLVCPEHAIDLIEASTQFGARWHCPVTGCTVCCWNGHTSTPADDRTRAIRHECHNIFDKLWVNGGWSRDTAYEKLSEVMGLTRKDAHFGFFNAEQCERAFAWLKGLNTNGQPV